MDKKVIAIIALVVVALIGVIWSFRNSFSSGPAPKGEADAAAGKARMEKMLHQGSGGAPRGMPPQTMPPSKTPPR
jgi:hypothetical protein